MESTERSRIAAVARRYYLDGASRIEIADEFSLSRFKVARMLDAARELGIVTITINDDSPVDAALSEALAAHLGLDRAIVINAFGRYDDVRTAVGAAAADLLSTTLVSGEVVGIAWGRTLAAMTESFTTLPKTTIVQLTGTVGSELTESPVEIVRKAALSSGGTARPIFSPMLVDDPATAAALRRQTDVAAAMNLFDRVTTAVVAVGSWDPPISQLRDVVSPEERASLQREGVRAEVTGILVADDGRLVGADFTERCLTISAVQLLRIPRVLAVVAGQEKAKAVAAVSRAGLITTIVTDRALAEATLLEPPASARARRGDA